MLQHDFVEYWNDWTSFEWVDHIRRNIKYYGYGQNLERNTQKAKLKVIENKD